MTVQDSAPTIDALSPSPQSISWLGWASYLGASWTWCIGMWLPVLLVRDYGFLGWLVFAAPNVLGAAAMGHVIKTRQQSRDLVREHRVAAVAFSFVTIVFHVFWISWIIRNFVGWWGEVGFIAVAALVWLIGRRSLRRDVLLSAITLTISAVALVWLVGWDATHHLGSVSTILMRGNRDLPWLLMVCVFGFAFCPYLDLTFHRARMETSDDDAPTAFNVGFGIFFLAMIIFTLWYARVAPWGSWMIIVIAIHMIVQAGFTVAIHFREATRQVSRSTTMLLLVAILAAIAWFAIVPSIDMRHGERTYREFMAFYGLVFPAYVWICMIGARTKRPMLAREILFVVAVLCAAPFYWSAFIDQQMPSVVFGLLIVLISPLVLFLLPKSKAIASENLGVGTL